MNTLTAETLNHEGVLALRNAIVEQAAHDYIRHYNVDGPQSSFITAIERWFRSSQFEDLGTGCSGEWFIENLREHVINGKKSKNKRVIQKGRTKNRDLEDLKYKYEYQKQIKKIEEYSKIQAEKRRNNRKWI